MTRTRGFLILALLVLAAGLAFQNARENFRQRTRLDALRLQAELREKQMPALRQEREVATQRMKQAEEDLAALQAKLAETEAARNSPRELEIKSWLARVSQLQQLFEQRPDQQIPEMQLLPPDAWITIGRAAELDSDEHVRKALAALRDSAKSSFMPRMADALKKFIKASDGELPSSMLALAPYFDPPADAAILQRYEMVQTGKAAARSLIPAIQEKSPVDEDYDARFSVKQSGGWGANSHPLAWVVDDEKLRGAYQAAIQAGNGAEPSSLSQVIPYLDPPLSPAQIEKALKAERKR